MKPLPAHALALFAALALTAARATDALTLLEQHCVSCHGGEKTKAGLDLTTRENLLRGGESGPSGPARVPPPPPPPRPHRPPSHPPRSRRLRRCPSFNFQPSTFNSAAVSPLNSSPTLAWPQPSPTAAIPSAAGQLVSFGRADLRALLVQSAQNALNQKASPLHTWGWKLCLRKGHKNISVVAIARKLTVSIWYLLRALFAPLPSIDATLRLKLEKLATAIGLPAIRHRGYASTAAFIAEKTAWLLEPT